MVKSTHKTIQDYFNPAAKRTPRHAAARQLHNQSFGSILRGTLSRAASDRKEPDTGLGIKDYMRQRMTAIAPHKTISARPAVALSATADGEVNAKPVGRTQQAAAKTSPVGNEGDDVQKAIRSASAKYGIPRDLIHSVIRCESNFKPDAVSPAGAQGLMQLMPGTAAELGVSDPFDIHQNIHGGARYLRQMLDRFDGDLERALAAYNAGPGTVSRYGGVPPYRETQTYVQKVMRYAALEGDPRVG
jgi:soluble lytic murein transglycosylase-like protein